MTPYDHPDYIALINELRRNPSDHVRRVIADWLEEQGESERAEFIRVQVNNFSKGCTAFMMSCGEMGIECRCWDETRHREGPLLCVYHRGFITELHGPLAAIDKYAHDIARREPLTEEGVCVTDARLTLDEYSSHYIAIAGGGDTPLMYETRGTEADAIAALNRAVGRVVMGRAGINSQNTTTAKDGA